MYLVNTAIWDTYPPGARVALQQEHSYRKGVGISGGLYTTVPHICTSHRCVLDLQGMEYFT